MLRRSLLVVLLGAAAVLVGVSAARAQNVFYFVSGYGDLGGSCAPSPDIPGAIACTTLRSAVAAAGADQGDDQIYLQPGTYTLNSELALTTAVDLFGGNARNTIITGSGAGRLFTVAGGVEVAFYGLQLTGGRMSAGDGGAIDNAGSLDLYETQITGNQALSGGGIANEASGTLDLFYSLVDHNTTPRQSGSQGGGIVNHGSLTVVASTIALNQGYHVGGIASDATQSATFSQATVADNEATSGAQAGGVDFAGPWTASGSLFVANKGDNLGMNCETAESGGSGNVEDGSGCGFGTAGTGLPTHPVTLVDDGGMTNVVTPTGTAKSAAASCSWPADQRLAQRDAGERCDAGAYQQGVKAPPVTPFFTIPTPTATATPGPTPTVTPAPTPPTPEFHKDVVVKPISGKVRVKLPGTNTFIDLASAADIPLGSTIDVKAGKLQLSSVPKKNGKPQTATFFDGIFKITQPGSITDLKLNEALAACPKRGKASAAAAKKKPKTRKLWGSGSGAFRTSGTYSAATVRGTEWLVQDSCAGTLTRVKHGVVSVRDNVRHKTIVVRAGHRYLAKPKH